MAFSDEGKLACEVRFAPFSTIGENRNVLVSAASSAMRTSAHNSRDPSMDILEREASQVLDNAFLPAVMLHTFPKSVLELNVEVLQDGGSVLAASCVAATAAMADAGVQNYDIVAACEVAKVNGTLIVDPTAHEEAVSTGGLLIAVMPSLNEITQLFQFGEMTQEDINNAIELCLDGCGSVAKVVTKVLLDSLAAAADAPK